MDKKKKLFILLICILPLMLVTLGFSTWIVIHEISIAPKFDPDSVFYNELNGQTVVYDGTAQLPSSDKIDVNSTFINTKYRKVGQGTSEYKDGIPTNAGEYYIYFNDTRDDATSLGASDVLFTIKKATVKETTNVTVNYNQGTNNGYFTTDMTTSSISYAGTFSHKENNSLIVDGTISYSDTRTKLEIGEYDYSYTFTPSPITDEWGDSVTNYEVYNDDTALIKTKATITFMNGSSQYGSIQHIELNGKIANPGNLSKTGYTFDGWEYNDSIWNFDTGVTTDMTLYSSFSIINYTLTYLDNDGSTLTTSNPKTYTIETATFTLTNPTKNGYVFEGWTESNSSNILSTVTISKGSTGNKTFTANWWKPITINMPSDITKDYDKSAVVLSDPSLKINYENVSSLPTGATISYTYSSGSSEMVNYGEYTVTATLTLTEELIIQGYKLDTTYSDLVTKVKINKKTIQVDYTWNYSSAFTYDTQTKTVKLKNEPAGLTPIYSNNSYTNAGKYTASVSFAEANNDNYVITGTASTLEWEIKKAQIDCSGVKLSATSFTYDEQTKTVSVQGIPSNVNSNITGTLSAVNAGNYTVTPGLTVSNSNYELINVTTELLWNIKPAPLSLENISWNYNGPYTYNGETQTVSIFGDLSAVEVEYKNNTAIDYGTYEASVTLTSVDTNYYISNTVPNLTWQINKATPSISEKPTTMLDLLFEEEKIEDIELYDGTVVGVKGESISGTFELTESPIFTTGENDTTTDSVTVLFKSSDSNYTNVTTEIDVQVMAVAYIDTTYYGTIEKAIGDSSSGKKIYVIPELDINPGIYNETTIPSGAYLYLPYSGSTCHDYLNGSPTLAYESGTLVTKVVVKENITLTNNGTIVIGAIQNSGNGGLSLNGNATKSYCEMYLEKGSNIINNGNIECYGYITGDVNSTSKLPEGKVINKNGSTCTMPFTVVEHRGGQVYVGMSNTSKSAIESMLKASMKPSGTDAVLTCYPFNRWFIDSFINVYFDFEYGSQLTGKAALYADGENNLTDINIIGNSSSYLVNLYESSILSGWFDKTNKKMKLETYGSWQLGNIKITFKTTKTKAGIDVTCTIHMKSNDILFPLSHYISITLNPFKNGGVATVDALNQGIKLLPGSVLKVNNNVKLNLKSLSIYENSSFYPNGTSIETNTIGNIVYPVKEDALFINNGECVATNIGGKILTTLAGASIKITTNNIVSKELTSTQSDTATITIMIFISQTVNYKAATYTSISLDAKGNISTSGTVVENAVMTSGSTYTSDGSNWILQ